MESINKALQSLGLGVKGFLSNEYCEHETSSFGKRYTKSYQKTIINGVPTCPECWKKENDKPLEEEMNHQFLTADRERKKNLFVRHSIMENESITAARLSNYKTDCEETAANKLEVQDVISRIKSGEVLNVFIVGTQGAGKSHLAYSILHELMAHYWRLSDGDKHGNPDLYQEMKGALYVETEALMRRIKGSFSDKDSKYTEDYCVRMMIDADFLVIDDLGAESGSINSDKEASNFIQRVLYAVTNGRQGKTTITTTNLSSEDLFNKYDKKLVSRILQKAAVVKFEKTTDKRVEHLGF